MISARVISDAPAIIMSTITIGRHIKTNTPIMAQRIISFEADQWKKFWYTCLSVAVTLPIELKSDTQIVIKILIPKIPIIIIGDIPYKVKN